MRSYSASEARKKMSMVLDAAERGETVLIGRRGVEFELKAHRRTRIPKRKPMFNFIDPAVEAGSWTWVETPNGWEFRAKPVRPRTK